MSGVEWRRTELTRDLIRCDNCGKKADTVHFLTDGDYPGKGEKNDDVQAVFACPKHDAGGYHVELGRWFDPKENFQTHIGQKAWGKAALGAIHTRFDQILRDAAEADRKGN
jgi:hypothetical protein